MKKIYCFILFISFFLGINYCKAEIQTYDRNTLDNYGVNKKWKITNSNKDNVLRTPAVDADLKIYDFADILSDYEEETIYDLSIQFYEDTGMDLVFLTANFYNTTDEENEEYAVDFYDYNDFGIEDENYSGIIVFRNSYESYPYYAIYTFGEAQYYFSNSRVDNILDYIYSDMRAGNYLDAFTYVIEKLNYNYSIGRDSSLNNYFLDENGFLKEKYKAPILMAIIISGIITAVVIGVLVKKNKMVYKARLAHDYLDNNSINYTVKNDQFVTSKTRSYSTSSGGSGSSGGGSRGGSSGGGHGGGGRRG